MEDTHYRPCMFQLIRCDVFQNLLHRTAITLMLTFNDISILNMIEIEPCIPHENIHLTASISLKMQLMSFEVGKVKDRKHSDISS